MMTHSKRTISLAETISRHRLIQIFFFGMFFFLLWQMAKILSPFAIALLSATILALIVYPFHAWILRRLPRKPSLAAGLSTSAIVLLVVLPLLALLWVSIREMGKLYPTVQGWVQEARTLRHQRILDRLPPRAAALWAKGAELVEKANLEPRKMVLESLGELSRRMTRMATVLIKNTFLVLFNLLVLTFTLFFFLRDGPDLISRMIELVPMAADDKAAILQRTQLTLFAVVRGVLVVAAVQGVLAGIGFSVFGIPFPVLLGALTTLLSPIPFVGAAGVWLPVVVILVLTSAYKSAVGLFLWGALVVGVIDNFLRPILVSSDAKIPILLLFFGIMGGLKVYGFMGLLLGPLVIAMLLCFINIYRKEYHWLLNPPKKEGAG